MTWLKERMNNARKEFVPKSVIVWNEFGRFVSGEGIPFDILIVNIDDLDEEKDYADFDIVKDMLEELSASMTIQVTSFEDVIELHDAFSLLAPMAARLHSRARAIRESLISLGYVPGDGGEFQCPTPGCGMETE